MLSIRNGRPMPKQGIVQVPAHPRIQEPQQETSQVLGHARIQGTVQERLMLPFELIDASLRRIQLVMAPADAQRTLYRASLSSRSMACIAVPLLWKRPSIRSFHASLLLYRSIACFPVFPSHASRPEQIRLGGPFSDRGLVLLACVSAIDRVCPKLGELIKLLLDQCINLIDIPDHIWRLARNNGDIYTMAARRLQNVVRLRLTAQNKDHLAELARALAASTRRWAGGIPLGQEHQLPLVQELQTCLLPSDRRLASLLSHVALLRHLVLHDDAVTSSPEIVLQIALALHASHLQSLELVNGNLQRIKLSPELFKRIFVDCSKLTSVILKGFTFHNGSLDGVLYGSGRMHDAIPLVSDTLQTLTIEKCTIAMGDLHPLLLLFPNLARLSMIQSEITAAFQPVSPIARKYSTFLGTGTENDQGERCFCSLFAALPPQLNALRLDAVQCTTRDGQNQSTIVRRSLLDLTIQAIENLQQQRLEHLRQLQFSRIRIQQPEAASILVQSLPFLQTLILDFCTDSPELFTDDVVGQDILLHLQHPSVLQFTVQTDAYVPLTDRLLRIFPTLPLAKTIKVLVIDGTFSWTDGIECIVNSCPCLSRFALPNHKQMDRLALAKLQQLGLAMQ